MYNSLRVFLVDDSLQRGWYRTGSREEAQEPASENTYRPFNIVHRILMSIKPHGSQAGQAEGACIMAYQRTVQ